MRFACSVEAHLFDRRLGNNTVGIALAHDMAEKSLLCRTKIRTKRKSAADAPGLGRFLGVFGWDPRGAGGVSVIVAARDDGTSRHEEGAAGQIF
jgi:hypothetical protein